MREMVFFVLRPGSTMDCRIKWIPVETIDYRNQSGPSFGLWFSVFGTTGLLDLLGVFSLLLFIEFLGYSIEDVFLLRHVNLNIHVKENLNNY